MGILSNNKNVKSFNEVQYLTNLEKLDLSGDFNLHGDLPMSGLSHLQEVNVEGTELDVTLPSTSTLTEVKLGTPTKVVIPTGTSIDSTDLTIQHSFNLKQIDIKNLSDSGGISKYLSILENRAAYNALSNTISPTFNYTVKSRLIEFTFDFGTSHEIIITETDNNNYMTSKFNKTITLDSSKYVNTTKQYISLEFYDLTSNTKGTLTFCFNLYDYLAKNNATQLSKLTQLEDAGLDLHKCAIDTNLISSYCSDTVFTTLLSYPTTDTASLIGKETTIQINQQGTITNCALMITGDTSISQSHDSSVNVVAWIRAHSHAYVTQYVDSTLKAKQLSDTDRTLYADGTSAATDITSTAYDVMMKLPKFYYKSELLISDQERQTDIYEISFSAYPVDSSWLTWDGDTFIGVYEAGLYNASNITDENPKGIINPTAGRSFTTGDKCCSISGIKPCVYYSQSSFKSAARAKGSNYQIVTFEAHSIIGLLFYAYYGNTNAQAICGSGTGSYPKNTGLRNDIGMADTIAGTATGTSGTGNASSTQFFGLENWWGDIYEWVDNLRTTGNYQYAVCDKNNTVLRTYQADNTIQGQEIAKMDLSNGELAIKSGVNNGNYNTLYADYGYVYSGAGSVAYRSSNASYANGGVACLNLAYGASGVFGAIGSRLLYQGTYLIVSTL